jgi:hypothetical protein
MWGVCVLTVAATASARADECHQVLHVFPAAPYAYELALEKCPGAATGADAACSFTVALLQGGKSVDRVRLAQPACGPASPASPTRTLGADRDAKVWSTSDDNCEIQVAARTVTLGPNVTALLVTELQGFEYRYRSHALYLSRKDTLAELWRHEEDAIGSHSTTTAVIPGALGGQDVAFIDVARDATGIATKVGARRLHLDAATGQIVGAPLPDAGATLFVVRVGSFKRGREAQRERSGCRHDLLPMQGRSFAGLRLPTFFLGDVFARRDEADAAVAKLATCQDGKQAATVHEYQATRATTKRSANAGHR